MEELKMISQNYQKYFFVPSVLFSLLAGLPLMIYYFAYADANQIIKIILISGIIISMLLGQIIFWLTRVAHYLRVVALGNERDT